MWLERGCGPILRGMHEIGWVLVAAMAALAPGAAVHAQSPWRMQESGTAAGLRGIDSVDGKVAWAKNYDIPVVPDVAEVATALSAVK